MKVFKKNKFLTAMSVCMSMTMLLGSTGCSQYKSSWSCNNPEGIGCSSIGHADRVARKHIILNDQRLIEDPGRDIAHGTNKNKVGTKKLLIREHYSDFKKHKRKEVDLD